MKLSNPKVVRFFCSDRLALPKDIRGTVPVKKSTGRFICPNCGYALFEEEMWLLMANIACPSCGRFRRDDFQEEFTVDFEPMILDVDDEV